MRTALTLALLASTLPFQAEAETLTYSSGTGFFINRDGYVLTNNHVIKDCGHITLHGALPMTDARLVATDKEFDLALLKTDSIVTDAAALTTEKQPLRVGDPVVVVGFPGQSWQTGESSTREARIVNTRGPQGEEKWLGFSDSLAQGNSGGPLLDASGNVVGVVVAKARVTAYNEVAAREETVQQLDIAISLPVVRQFLEKRNIMYQQADSGIYLAADRVTDIARRFVVNVRCKIER